MAARPLAVASHQHDQPMTMIAQLSNGTPAVSQSAVAQLQSLWSTEHRNAIHGYDVLRPGPECPDPKTRKRA